jgi:hypothetical protein
VRTMAPVMIGALCSCNLRATQTCIEEDQCLAMQLGQ